MATKNRTVYYPNPQFSAKDPVETENFYFNWAGKLQNGETISTATVTMTVASGVDANPSAMKSGNAVINGTLVKQVLQGGLNGVTYNASCAITTNLGSNYAPLVATLQVKNG